MLSDWQRPPPGLTLVRDDVHVWRLQLGGDSEMVQEAREILNASERARADRFHFEKDHRQYALTRAVLRRLAGHYLGVPARRIDFGYAPRNKPFIAGSQNFLDLQFNVSHAGERALLAFCLGRQIGVDLESSGRLSDWMSVAGRIFSTRERAELDSLPAAQRRLAFFNGWTRKEAYLKATGDGLVDELKGIEVTLSPEVPARILAIHGDETAPGKWSMHSFRPFDTFAGALVVEGTGAGVRLWDWSMECFPGSAASA